MPKVSPFPTTTTTTTSSTIKEVTRHIPKLILRCENDALREQACKIFRDPKSSKEDRDAISFLCIDFTEKQEEKKRLTQNLEYYDLVQSYVYDCRNFFNTGK